MTRAVILLEDGTTYPGFAQNVIKSVFGEVVFNTAMSGYQESFTDPSYAGQILVMTYPLIGNYGFHQNISESDRTQIRGLIIKEPAFFSTRGSRIAHYLADAGIPMLWGVDTRALTLKLRDHGTMKGMILVTDRTAGLNKPLARIRRTPHPDRDNLVQGVSCAKVAYHVGRSRKRVVLIDCGVKKSIVANLRQFAQVIQVPWFTEFEVIQSFKPHGIMISNGPGNPEHPAVMMSTVKTIRKLVDKYPVFGICLGHQLLGLALGGKTFKLKFGHRGYNHAVKDLATSRIYITSQNHGYALDPAVRIPDIEYDWLNVNDGTVEGMTHRTRPVFSVQFHPEAAPGPHDTSFLFRRFLEMT
jgi:carbamoyl-phosphate synthase small subunit